MDTNNSTKLQFPFTTLSPSYYYEDDIMWKPGHHMNDTFTTFAFVYLLVVVITSIACNLTLISVILTKQSLRTTYAHIFVINLAISDLVTALTAVTFDIDFIMQRVFTHGKFACSVMQISFWISLPSSVISLFLLTLERLSAVMFPFLRLRIIHNRFITPFVICLIWVYTVMTSIIPLFIDRDAIDVMYGYCVMNFPKEYGLFQLVVNFIIPTCLIIIMNVFMYVKARKNKKNAKHKVKHAKDDEERRDSMQILQGIREDIQAANRILALVFATLVCWLTYIVFVVTNMACGVCHSEELTYTGNLINYTSIALNPILYGLLNSKIRREVIRKICYIDKFNFLSIPSENSSYNSSRRATHDINLSRRTTGCDYALEIPSSYQSRRGGVGLPEYTKLSLSSSLENNNNTDINDGTDSDSNSSVVVEYKSRRR